MNIFYELKIIRIQIILSKLLIFFESSKLRNPVILSQKLCIHETIKKKNISSKIVKLEKPSAQSHIRFLKMEKLLVYQIKSVTYGHNPVSKQKNNIEMII
jgi:hypothetical protein